ncbi:MAG: PilZ domain-containing protein [Nitrospirae bacterium]|nr:PilZ domain-containing protein [Nitrospirota bacterium]
MEKRSYDRIPASLKIKLCLDNDINTGTLVNLSRSGMLINTKVCFPLKSQFDILLPSGDDILKIPVKVSRLLKKGNAYDGIGVELLDPSSRYFEFLASQSKNSTINDRKIKTYVCTVCNHIAFGQVPIVCPFCNGSIDNFYDNTGEVNTLSDFKSLADFEKKHFPVINVARGGGPEQAEAPIDVHVTVGEIQHKMDIDDRITFIDFYFNDLRLNKKCLARVNLNCHIVNPDATIRFHETASGTLTVVSNCNAHGSWMAETNI